MPTFDKIGIEIAEAVQLLQGQLHPSQLADLKVHLAANYFFFSEQLSGILTLKAETWESLRAKCTSDMQAERSWQRTEGGLGEMRLRAKLKSIEKLLSAISTKIAVAEQEAKMNF